MGTIYTDKSLQQVSSTLAFGGSHQQFLHDSCANDCKMKFAIYLPPQASKEKPVPVLYWLSGLTCTDENFMQKAGALKLASQLGIAIVAPDTSPRGEYVPDDEEGAYDFGLGAGFYVNATQSPWSKHYNMYDYIVKELVPLINTEFPVTDKCSLSGHSMGGHGALTIGLKHPDIFVSISAFSPICNPMDCAWGQKAFSNYLGDNQDTWKAYDACELLKEATTHLPILVDQGTSDNFLESQLKTESLVKTALACDYEMQVNMHSGYDHSYYFISSFIDSHLAFHAQFLNQSSV